MTKRLRSTYLRSVQRDAGDWEAVDAVFRDPPQMTTLIFHPERYLASERTTPTLDVPVKAGETLQTEAIRGEYSDALGILQTSDDRTVHHWVIQFDSAETASDWIDHFSIALEYDSQLPATPCMLRE
ncbi:MAG: hypothetical protein AAFN18_22395 [Cyanobacteria bacterium J06554_6]